MPDKDGNLLPPLPPSSDPFWDGEKYSQEIKSSDHKCHFIKVSPTEIRCQCGKGYAGTNIDYLLAAFDNRK